MNKDIFQGKWAGNKRSYGKMSYNNKDVYDGHWYCTEANGYMHGTLTKANG